MAQFQIPISNAYGKPTEYTMDLESDGDGVRILIDGGFAGREVDEEVSLGDIAFLLNAEPGYKFEDLLGLILENGGEEIRGIVGVGSGNERFIISKADLQAAFDELSH
jgi:hypothetical protein